MVATSNAGHYLTRLAGWQTICWNLFISSTVCKLSYISYYKTSPGNGVLHFLIPVSCGVVKSWRVGWRTNATKMRCSVEAKFTSVINTVKGKYSGVLAQKQAETDRHKYVQRDHVWINLKYCESMKWNLKWNKHELLHKQAWLGYDTYLSEFL